MRIAVCDDERIAIENVVTLLEDYFHDKKIDIPYEVFERYPDLEPRIDEFNIFLMDYETPEIDGMSFARMIREKYGEEKAIIFITSYETVVYEAYEVRALRYILKPIKREKFYEALDAYLATNVVTKRLTVRQDGQVEAIESKDIEYIEANGKEITFHLDSGNSITCRDTLDSIEQKLDDFGFFRVHRKYLVNLKKVSSYMNNYVVLKSGESVELSTRKYADFRLVLLQNEG
ncbi:MAG: response regulator transcription factor [Clostridia bacterium]|nr:response regulator transcription factor [Clostridia bacterium]